MSNEADAPSTEGWVRLNSTDGYSFVIPYVPTLTHRGPGLIVLGGADRKAVALGSGTIKSSLDDFGEQ